MRPRNKHKLFLQLHFLHKIVKNVLQTFPNDKLMLDTHSDIDRRADTHILFCIDPLNVDIKHTEVTENRYSSLTEHQLAKMVKCHYNRHRALFCYIMSSETNSHHHILNYKYFKQHKQINIFI